MKLTTRELKLIYDSLDTQMFALRFPCWDVDTQNIRQEIQKLQDKVETYIKGESDENSVQ